MRGRLTRLAGASVLLAFVPAACGGSGRSNQAVKVVFLRAGDPYRFFLDKPGSTPCRLELGGVTTRYLAGTCTTSVAAGASGSEVVTLSGRWHSDGFWHTWQYTVKSGRVVARHDDGNVLPPYGA
jgi:hypothetical protein